MRVLLAGSFLFFLNISWAQTGPGGVGNSTSNVLWLSADNGVYSDAGVTPAVSTNNVGQWDDRSGNGSNASHGTVGERPNYQTNVVNGFPVIRFTTANADRLLSAGVTSGNAASVWAVASWSSLPSTNPGLIQGAPAGSAFSTAPADKVIGMWVSNGAGNEIWGRGVQSNNAIRDISQVTGTAVNTFYSFLSIFDGSANINQYVNNGVAGGNTYDGTLRSWSDFGIGRQGNESWNGDIAEVLVFNQAVNSAQRIIIDNYLAAKYNLTLSSNDVYTMDNPGNGNFDYEVAGIGRVNATNIHSDARGTSIVRISNATALGDGEFFMWGHNNGSLAVNTTDVPAGVQGRLTRVWRVSEPTNVGNLNVQFDLTGLGTVTVSDLRLLIDHDGDGIFNEAGTIQTSGATAVGGNNYLFTAVAGGNITNADRFTIGTINITQTPLPIELESFSGVMVDSDAHLKWITASEVNNHFFTIERSLSGTFFTAVGEVPGAGTSKVRKTYQYKDTFPPDGRLYYRLQQTDFDGANSYSDIITLDNKSEGIELIAVPNPVRSGHGVELRILHPEKIESKNVAVTVFDIFGRSISITIITDDQNQLMMNFNSSEASGTYLIRVRSPQLPAPLVTRIQLTK